MKHPPTAAAQQRLQSCHQELWQDASVNAVAAVPDEVIEELQALAGELPGQDDLAFQCELDGLFAWQLQCLSPADASEQGAVVLLAGQGVAVQYCEGVMQWQA